MKQTAIAFLLPLILFISNALAAPNPSDSLTLRIVPNSIADNGERAIILTKPEWHFHVVVTNTSQEPVKLWQESCSWGYFNLSFESTDQGGKIVLIKKKAKGWNKDFPTWTVLAAGEQWVVDVAFDESTWQNPPLSAKGKGQAIKLKAVFEIAPEPEAQERNIWTGKITSPQDGYTFYGR